MNAEEAWQHILRQYNMYQSKLKKFNYSPNGSLRDKLYFGRLKSDIPKRDNKSKTITQNH